MVLSAFLTACGNCICRQSEGLRLGLVSFDSTDVDTIIVRKFEKGNNFTHLVDTTEWDRTNVAFAHRNDTFEIGMFAPVILLKSGYDYKVVIPSVTKTFAITDMIEPKQMGNCSGKVLCVTSIVSCKLDGVATALQYETLYLRK
jgi:hypothetical protein